MNSREKKQQSPAAKAAKPLTKKVLLMSLVAKKRLQPVAKADKPVVLGLEIGLRVLKVKCHRKKAIDRK
jgi:hypothetical protein